MLTDTNRSDSVTLANVEASVQLKDQLKSANVTTSSVPAKPIINIQSAAVALNPAPAINIAGTPLAVPQSSSLTADQKQLVLISNIKAS